MKETIIFGLRPFDLKSGQTKTTKEISFTIEDLQKLLFRFSPNEIKIGDDIIIFRDKHMFISGGVNESPYIVTNKEQVYNLAVQAYNKLIATQMFYNAISFDFDAASDFMFKDVSDEFEDTDQ